MVTIRDQIVRRLPTDTRLSMPTTIVDYWERYKMADRCLGLNQAQALTLVRSGTYSNRSDSSTSPKSNTENMCQSFDIDSLFQSEFTQA